MNIMQTNSGGVAQLVEHLLCKQRVGGSRPSISTIFIRIAIMTLIAVSCLFIIFSFISVILFYKYKIASKEVISLTVTLDEYKNNLENLNNQHISDTATIASLNSNIEFLKQSKEEYKKTQEESFAAAKSSLFSMGSELSNQLIELHKKENLESRKLSEENIEKTSQKFNNEFEKIVESVSKLETKIQDSKDTMDLVKQSLLSPSGAGALAEITLENILKSSGLRAEIDYFLQYHLIGASSEKLRPDAVVFLPNNNVMIIDAKASKFLLKDEEELLNKTMLTHLKDLTSKEYSENLLNHLQKNNLEQYNIITLMFLPTEHAIEKIDDISSNFIQKAWDKGIFPVGPAGLVNMLSLAKFQITDNLRSENHQKILDEVKKLINSTSIIAEHSRKMSGNLQNMVSNYDKFAASFNRNFLSKAKTLSKLGIDSIKTKNIDISLERYQLISSKPEILDIDEIEEIEATKKLEATKI